MFAGQLVDKLTVRLDVPLLEVHARRLGKLGFETVHKCLIIEVEGFGECEATLLAKENLVDAPSAVAVPRRYDVSDQLVHSARSHPGQRHRLLVLDEPHEAVARTDVHFRVVGMDFVASSLQVYPVQLPIFAAELTVFVGIPDLPIPMRGVSTGYKQLWFVNV